MRWLLMISSVLLLAACSMEPGSENWCALKEEQAKSEWSASDAVTFARHCLLDGTAVGSRQWSQDMTDRTKADWTANDTASYAKHCII